MSEELQGFYHTEDCQCARCTKARQCLVKVLGVGRVITFQVVSPTGGEYLTTVNASQRIVTCNCPNGQHRNRPTCAHAQAAWWEHAKDDGRTALNPARVPLSVQMHEQQYFA